MGTKHVEGGRKNRTYRIRPDILEAVDAATEKEQVKNADYKASNLVEQALANHCQVVLGKRRFDAIIKKHGLGNI